MVSSSPQSNCLAYADRCDSPAKQLDALQHPTRFVRGAKPSVQQHLSLCTTTMAAVPAFWALLERTAAAEDLAALGNSSAVETFEPQLNSGVLVVCLIAATPPVLFWGRIFFSAWARQRRLDVEAKQQNQKKKDRDALKSKIFGDKR